MLDFVNLKTVVIDAGGRYGIHPSWRSFSGELDYYLFEPDPTESARLKAKYSNRSNEVNVLSSALSERNGKVKIDLFKNRAMSSSSKRNPVSSLFKGERLNEIEVIGCIDVDAVSIDSFCSETNLFVDFLKLDTEGSEHEILLGASKQLENSILGVRVEVSFDHIFEGKPLFGTISDYLMDLDFHLLNFDYVGRGDYQNEFVNTDFSYGILTSSDAVFLKRPRFLFGKKDGFKGNLEIAVMKYAAFCFNNGASDVGLDVLLIARLDYGANFDLIESSNLYRFIDLALHKHFYSLKWQPGQSLKNHSDCYFNILGKRMKLMNEFMESEELNPI